MNNLETIINALGWQGGTVHQVVEEIGRLKKLEADKAELVEAMMLIVKYGKTDLLPYKIAEKAIAKHREGV